MITMTNELTQWYLKDYLNNKQDDSKRILRCFLDNTNDKAMVLFIGNNHINRECHQQYLWRFPKNWSSKDELLKRIRETALWDVSFDHLDNFENLYSLVWDRLNTPRIPQIQQLVIYDIAVHLAYINEERLLPKDVVYIHALPLKAWNTLIKNHILNGFKANIPQVQFSRLSPYFNGLSALQIEDLLCELGKSMRRVKYGRASKNNDINSKIDSIVSRYINFQ